MAICKLRMADCGCKEWRSRERCVAGGLPPPFLRSSILNSPSSFCKTGLTPELLKQSGHSGGHSIGSGPVPAKTMSEPTLDVAACVELVRQKDEEAARRLVEHLYPVVFKLVRAYLPPRSSEEDLAQVVFYENVCQSGPVFEFGPLEHSVGQIAINTCLNQIQAEKTRPELRRADLSEAQCQVLDTLGAVSEELPPDQALAAREVVEKLLALLEPAERLLLDVAALR